VRNEAIDGLVARGDQSLLPRLIRELHNGLALPLLHAAIALARPELCDALTAAAAGGLLLETPDGTFDMTEIWMEAMRACGLKTPDCQNTNAV